VKVKVKYQNGKTEEFDIYDFEDTDPDCLLQNGIPEAVATITITKEGPLEKEKMRKLLELLELVAKT